MVVSLRELRENKSNFIDKLQIYQSFAMKSINKFVDFYENLRHFKLIKSEDIIMIVQNNR